MKNEIEKKKVLIVDDEPTIPLSLGWGLRRKGHDVHSAGSAEVAEECLLNHKYQMVIADYGLPGKNGIQLLESVKNTQPTAGRLLMTGLNDDFGCDGNLVHLLIRKPFGQTEIDVILGLLEDSCTGKDIKVDERR